MVALVITDTGASSKIPFRSFIISTHQVHDLQSLIDSVLVIAEGKILLHETLDTVSQRLSVDVEHQSPDDALFVEQTLDGYRVLRANESGIDSSVDLSLLFGFVTTQKARAQEMFARGAAV